MKHIASEFVKQPVKHLFPPQSVQNWEEAALKELEGDATLEKISIKKRGLTIKPYHTHEDLPPQLLLSLPESTDTYGSARHWVNMPKVSVQNARVANDIALEHLQNGATGVCFDLISKTVSVEELLAKIELPYCTIAFLADSSRIEFFKAFHAYAENNYKPAEITGCIFWKDKLLGELSKSFITWKNFKPAGIIIQPQENLSDELAIGLYNAILGIESQTKLGSLTKDAFASVSFSLVIGTDIFLELIMLRVLRLLWHTIEKAYNLEHQPLFIHASSPAWIKESYQPQGNLIKETYAAMVAIVGGCDALTIEAEDNTMMNRIARNTSSILHEESFFSNVADPLAGSYYIESVTKQLAEQTWKKFQELSNA